MIQVRKMTRTDFPAVAALDREIFSDAWTEQGFFDTLAQETNLFLAAVCRREENRNSHSGEADEFCDFVLTQSGKEEKGGAGNKETFGDAVFIRNKYAEKRAAGENGESIVGYCILYGAGDEGEIVRVAVAEEARRQGVGTRLLEELLTSAGQQGVRRIFLEVRKSNASAIRLYEKHGFVPCGMRRNFYRDPAEDALCMVRESDKRNNPCYYNGE